MMFPKKENRIADTLMGIEVLIGAALAVWILIKPELP